jgi:hypothetical protein
MTGGEDLSNAGCARGPRSALGGAVPPPPREATPGGGEGTRTRGRMVAESSLPGRVDRLPSPPENLELETALMPDTTPQHRARPTAGGRVAALVAAATAGLLAFGFLASGGGLLWADGKKDDQGYFSTGSDRFSTQTYAIATDELDVDADVPGWLLDKNRYGQARLRVTPRDGQPVFVGIAPTQDVKAYLRTVEHATVTDLDYEPFRADYRNSAGEAPQGAPSAQSFWTASAQGSDTQTVAWDVEEGSWSVVVMNADGSRGVDAGISVGARVAFLDALAWALIGIGTVLALAAAGLFYAGGRPPRTRPGSASLAPAAA